MLVEKRFTHIRLSQHKAMLLFWFLNKSLKFEKPTEHENQMAHEIAKMIFTEEMKDFKDVN